MEGYAYEVSAHWKCGMLDVVFKDVISNNADAQHVVRALRQQGFHVTVSLKATGISPAEYQRKMTEMLKQFPRSVEDMERVQTD